MILGALRAHTGKKRTQTPTCPTTNNLNNTGPLICFSDSGHNLLSVTPLAGPASPLGAIKRLEICEEAQTDIAGLIKPVYLCNLAAHKRQVLKKFPQKFWWRKGAN